MIVFIDFSILTIKSSEKAKADIWDNNLLRN